MSTHAQPSQQTTQQTNHPTDSAVAGSTHVIHVASPFPDRVPSNPEELIRPAVDGTLNVLKAVTEAGGVKRVVLTSSIAAVYDSSIPIPKEQETTKTFDEENWTDVDNASVDVYAKSKTLAEKAAWDYLKELPEEKKFELAVINPGMVIGPLLNKRFTTSHLAIKSLLDKSRPAYPKLNCNVTDVRDVAQAHLIALTLPEAAGKRHLIVNHSVWMKDLAAILQKEFRPKGYFVPSLTAPNFLVRVSSFVDKGARFVAPRLGREVKYDNKRVSSHSSSVPVLLS
jgi:nucleoside-diphosphate-sugar epimerase